MTPSRLALAAGYAIVAALAARAATVATTGATRTPPARESIRDRRRLRWLWIATTAIVAAFGISRALDTQDWVVGRLRAFGSAEGWYDERRRFQRIAVVSLLAAGVVAGGALSLIFRRSMKRALGALVGVTFLVSYVAIRLVSLHHIDAAFSDGAGSIGRVVEWAGLALIAASAVHASRAAPTPG